MSFIEFIETFDLLALSETWLKGSECVNVCNVKGVSKGVKLGVKGADIHVVSLFFIRTDYTVITKK